MFDVFVVTADASLELDDRRLARLTRGSLLRAGPGEASQARRVTICTSEGAHDFEAVIFDVEAAVILGWLQPTTAPRGPAN